MKILFDADERAERELTVYRFDGSTGILTGQRQVRGEYVGGGDRIYSLKANETMEEPPIVEDGHVAVFSEQTRKWFLVQDHRGETWLDWKGKPQLIGRVGNPAEWGLKRG
jgi:hypothetical protein